MFPLRCCIIYNISKHILSERSKYFIISSTIPTEICKIATLISEDEILLTILFIENDHYVIYYS